MSTPLARFRDLRGVGPATEARLHEAGLYTWESLADVLSALGNVKGGESVRELADLVAGHLAGQGPDTGNADDSDSERSEAFVLRIAVGPDGAARHTTGIHVPSQAEQDWPGWDAAAVTRFVEGTAGLAGVAAPGRGPAVRRPQPVAVDAGKVIGGRSRDVTLTVSTAPIDGAGEVGFTAVLLGRPLGDEGAWAELGRRAGTCTPPAPLRLPFGSVGLPAGITRLLLRLELTPSVPVTVPATLELMGDPG
jgi:hypothetical protein